MLTVHLVHWGLSLRHVQQARCTELCMSDLILGHTLPRPCGMNEVWSNDDHEFDSSHHHAVSTNWSL